MAKKEVEVTSQDILNARIDGMICRAKEAGRKKGFQEGFQKGFQEVKLETAKNMIQKGFATDEIAEITGLPIKSILNIK